MSTPTLTVIVVSYNTREITLACLRSLYEQTGDLAFETIVVDNASPDGSADAIAEAFPQATLIRRDDNLGFAGANNLAAQSATGDYLLLLNPDTVVLDSAVQRLIAFAKSRPEALIWGGRTLFEDRSLNPASCWKRQTPWSVFCRAAGLSTLLKDTTLFDPESYGSWPRDTVREVDIVSGCFFLIERSTWERLGGFDPAFFMYGEEADLCLRAARELGARPAVTPEATIVHLGGASENVRADKLVRLLDAKARLIRRHWSPLTAGFGVAMLKAWSISRGVAGWLTSVHGHPARREAAQAWMDAWRRRSEWSKRTLNSEGA